MADDSLQTDIAARIDPLCEQFKAAWQCGEEPGIDEFVEKADPVDREAVRVELLRLDRAYRQRQQVNADTPSAMMATGEFHPVVDDDGNGDPSQTPTQVASRDLLFGRLALQTGLIDQEALANAISQQETDPSRSLARILVEGGSISQEDRQAIDHLCERHFAKHGDPQQSLAALTLPPTVSYRESPGTNTVPFVQKPTDGKQFQDTFGDYELLGEIARGGMGVVYKARQTKLNRLVALKMIRSGELADAEQVKRFYAEAEAAAKLDHPGIVPVYEVGEARGQHFFSMAFVAGRSLNDSVKSGGPLPAQQAARLMKTVAEAVQFAHEKGVVHRDIKPQNILLDEKDQPRVADFGLAKQVEALSELTASGQVMGTPSYMPPEQALGQIRDIGPISDVYSLGATLYFLLTGRPPFQTSSTAETLRQVIEAEPVAIRRLNPAIPLDLETICLKCLRKEQARRYATSSDLAADLDRWLENKPIFARPVGRSERAWLWCKRRPAIAGLSAALVIFSLVGSLVAVEMRNAARATGLVGTLVSADVAQVPQILAELESYRRRATPSLLALAGTEPKTLDERRAQLHARLALVSHDEQQVTTLLEELLAGNLAYVGVVRDRLAPYRQRLEADLWQLLHDPTKEPARRFRAGLALAAYATVSDQWAAADYALLAEQLVAANAEQQPRLRDYLRPISDRLLNDLERLFAERAIAEGQQLAAANALADFATEDIVRLAQLLMVATPAQFGVVYPLVAEAYDPSARKILAGVVDEVPAADMPQVKRLALGQRRAGAAIALLRQGEREAALGALRVDDDPESLTQFVHRLRARGVRPNELIECLDHTDQARRRKTGDARKIEDRVLFGLLLALGEFDLTDLPNAERNRLILQLVDWYGHDRSSAIHGAAGWLLRHWKQEELARKVDQTPVPYAPEREWYTLETKAKSGGILGFGAQEQSFYITFVVFPAGKYLIGSPLEETNRHVTSHSASVGNRKPRRAISTRQFVGFPPESFASGIGSG